MESIVPSLWISSLKELTYSETVEKRMLELVELEEEHFIARFHQQVQKACEMAWNDRYIKQKKF